MKIDEKLNSLSLEEMWGLIPMEIEDSVRTYFFKAGKNGKRSHVVYHDPSKKSNSAIWFTGEGLKDVCKQMLSWLHENKYIELEGVE